MNRNGMALHWGLALVLASALSGCASTYDTPSDRLAGIQELGRRCEGGRRNACMELREIVLGSHEKISVSPQVIEETSILQAALADFIINHSVASVRQDALEHLTDQVALSEIATTDENEYVRREAVRKLEDQTLLFQFATTDPDRWMRADAAGALTDTTMLMALAMSDDSPVARAAAARLTDQGQLARLAFHAADVMARREVIRRITDEAVLIDIATTDTLDRNFTTWMRKPAISNFALTDRAVIVELAASDESREIRRGAALRLAVTDQGLFRQLYDGNSDDQLSAIEECTNQAALAALAKFDPSREVRLAAVEKITDQDVLADVVKNGLSSQPRVAATGELTDEALLAELAEHNSSSLVRGQAVRNRNLNDQDLFERIARSEDPDAPSNSAIARITDKDLLISLLTDDHFPAWKRIWTGEVLMRRDLSGEEEELVTDSLIRIALAFLLQRDYLHFKDLRATLREMNPEAVEELRRRTPRVSVTGRLIETGNGRPFGNVQLFFVEVTDDDEWVFHADLVTTTDAEGGFVLEGVPLGLHAVAYSESLPDVSAVFPVIVSDAFDISQLMVSGVGSDSVGTLTLTSTILNVSLTFQVLNRKLREVEISRENHQNLQIELSRGTR